MWWQPNPFLSLPFTAHSTLFTAQMLMTNSQIRDTLHCQSRTKVKVVKWCEMGIFQCISITNNVKSYKKMNEIAQTAKFTVFTMCGSELPAEKAYF